MSLYVLHETCNEKEPCTQYRATSTFARARIMLKVGGSSTVYGDIFRYTHFSVFAGTPKLTKMALSSLVQTRSMELVLAPIASHVSIVVRLRLGKSVDSDYDHCTSDRSLSW